MKQFLKQLKSISLLIWAISVITACKKNSSDDALPPPDQTAKEFRIHFSNASINLADVDSAEIVLTKAGASSITKKLEKASGYMFAAADNVPEGNWQAEWLVYTKKPATGYARQFSRTTNISLPLTAGKTEQAPIGDWSEGWNPRVLAHDEAANITVIVAMNFTDPYFALLNKGPEPFRYFYIDRMARMVNGTQSQVVSAMAFERFINIPASGITDRKAFLPLAADIQGKPWNEGEILVEVLDARSLDRTFYFRYSK